MYAISAKVTNNLHNLISFLFRICPKVNDHNYYVIQDTGIDSFNTFLFTYKVETNAVENLLIH